MNFCDLQRFWRKTALLRPKITRTDLQSPEKNGTSAETYGEPQTPVNRFAVALSSELPESSTAVLAAKRVYPPREHLPAFDGFLPADGPQKGRPTPGPTGAQLFCTLRGDGTP